jgi:hypothetical protein
MIEQICPILTDTRDTKNDGRGTDSNFFLFGTFDKGLSQTMQFHKNMTLKEEQLKEVSV